MGSAQAIVNLRLLIKGFINILINSGVFTRCVHVSESGPGLTGEDSMFVVLPAKRALDQPASLLQRRQEVSLVLVDDVHNLEDKHHLMTISCYIT